MAEILKFNDGFKEFAVNGDESRIVRFNPCDFGILERISASQDKLDELEKKYRDAQEKYKDVKASDSDIDELGKIAAECDSEIRAEINTVFGNDVCTPAFGTTNCLSLAGGSSLFENFLDAMLPIVKSYIDKETKQSKKRIAKYTNSVKK